VFDRFERSATSRARMCLPRSLPTSSPRRRGQRGARAAQRARTTLTLISGDARSAARKALAGQHAQRRAIGAQPNCLDPLKNRRKTGTNHSPSAPAQNLCLRRRNPSSNPFGDPHSCRKTLSFALACCCRAYPPGGDATELGPQLTRTSTSSGAPAMGPASGSTSSSCSSSTGSGKMTGPRTFAARHT
jgi:hypothetical protein